MTNELLKSAEKVADLINYDLYEDYWHCSYEMIEELGDYAPGLIDALVELLNLCKNDSQFADNIQAVKRECSEIETLCKIKSILFQSEHVNEGRELEKIIYNKSLAMKSLVDSI